jgi:protein TonB
MIDRSINTCFIGNNSYYSNSLLLWLFIAALFHAIILLGVNFVSPEAKKISRAIEITIVNLAIRQEPEKAHYLAQEHQLGAGLKKQKPKPNEQKIPRLGKDKQQRKKIKPKKKQKKPSHRLITQKNKAKTNVVQTKKIAPETIKQPTKLSVATLDRQIAQLGERVKYLQQSAEKTTMKFVNSISTHKYVAAQYVRDWERKVERIGNLNYPKIARKKGFSGLLSMDVGIKSDGTIYNIRITRSSGTPSLDNAAKNIVRMSAPFSALPQPIAKQLDVLIIRRVWRFTDESRLSL